MSGLIYFVVKNSRISPGSTDHTLLGTAAAFPRRLAITGMQLIAAGGAEIAALKLIHQASFFG
jgi:hypothetical protein